MKLRKYLHLIMIDENKIVSLTTYLCSAVGALHPPRSWALNTFPHLFRYVLLLWGQLAMMTEKCIWKGQLDITDIALCNSNFVNFNFHNFIFAYQILSNHWAVFHKLITNFKNFQNPIDGAFYFNKIICHQTFIKHFN